MFERFTHPARAAVVQAQQQARSLGHTGIRAEHILLGIMADGQSIATRVLTDLGVQRAALLREMAVLGSADADVQPISRRRELFRRPVSVGGHLRFTDAARHALKQSLRQAMALGHNYIGTEHLLLGLVAQDHEPVSLTLQRLGVAPADVRAGVREALTRAA